MINRKIWRSKKAFFLLKLFISSALIFYLFYIRKIDLMGVGAALKKADIFWLIVGLSLLGLGRIITACRWKILLSAQEIYAPLKRLLISLFVANFFNLFLPSTIGGDAIRAYDVSRDSHRPGTSILTILIERIMGMFALVIIAAFSLIFAFFLRQNFWEKYQIANLVWPVIGWFIITLIGMLTISFPHFSKAAVFVFNKMGFKKIEEMMKRGGEVLNALKSNRGSFTMGFLLSILLQINVIVYTYVIALSLNLKVPFIYFCLIVPLIFIILLIPFSINGIGIRESAYLFFLGGFVLSSETVALSWTLFFMTMVMGAIGGLVYVGRGEPIPKKYR